MKAVDVHDAYQQIGRFLTDAYNRKWIGNPLGASLGCLTPTEFEASLPQQSHVVVAFVP